MDGQVYTVSRYRGGEFLPETRQRSHQHVYCLYRLRYVILHHSLSLLPSMLLMSFEICNAVQYR